MRRLFFWSVLTSKLPFKRLLLLELATLSAEVLSSFEVVCSVSLLFYACFLFKINVRIVALLHCDFNDLVMLDFVTDLLFILSCD